MKTKQQKSKNQNQETNSNGKGLRSRSEQLGTNADSKCAETPNAPQAEPEKDNQQSAINNQPIAKRPYINYQQREQNRQLPKERVLELLRRWMPRQYELAEVVGNWIWITFQEQPVQRVRQELSQFGFHWNNMRKCWQHPCGQVTAGSPNDPREKYGSHFAADQKAA